MTDTVIGLLTRNATLAADIRRLCAIAGRSLCVSGADAETAALWRSAALVLVDADAADLLPTTAGASRRDGLVVLSDDPDALDAWRLAAAIGATRVLSVRDEPEVLRLLALAGESAATPGPVYGVLGGSGGAGASTLAAALGLVAAADRDATLVDLDATGGGLDLLLGLEHDRGARWSALADARGLVASDALRAALPRTGRLALLSADRLVPDGVPPAAVPADAVSVVVAAARRGGGTVVLDLPRPLPDAAGLLAATCDRVVLVVAADIRALAAAAWALAHATARCGDVQIVLRTGARGGLRPAQVAGALGRPLAAVVATEPGIAAAADLGRLPAALRRSKLAQACRLLLDDPTPSRVSA